MRTIAITSVDVKDERMDSKAIVFGLALLVGLVATVGMTGATAAEKTAPTIGLEKVSVGGGGWSVSLQGTTATIRAPNGVVKVVTDTRAVAGCSSSAPYRCYCYYASMGGGRWIYF